MCWWTSIPAGHGARPVSWGTSAWEDTAPGSRSSSSPAIPIRRPCCGRSSPPPPSSCWTRGSSAPPGRRELKKSPYVPDDIGVHKPYARPENIAPVTGDDGARSSADGSALPSALRVVRRVMSDSSRRPPRSGILLRPTGVHAVPCRARSVAVSPRPFAAYLPIRLAPRRGTG